jgi:hypothetical protein
MKKIFTTTNPAEAHLLVEALRQEGIAASVQGEWGSLEGPSVWIENDSDAARSDALVSEMVGKAKPTPPSTQSLGHSGVFFAGLFLGLLIGALTGGAFSYGSAQRGKAPARQSWDLNGDGKADKWNVYDSMGRLVESSEDRNADGKPDCWLTFDPPDVLHAARYDQDVDGRMDYWEIYEKGFPASYTADNDGNGVVDEWGRFESGAPVERNWSFANDRVADRRVSYRSGRKTREEYDRNRDGKFDETVEFDAFERAVARR